MRLASFNVENLFERARALNEDQWLTAPEADPSRWSGAGKAILDAYAALNAVLRKPIYSDADKAQILQLLTTLDLERKDETAFVILRRNKGQLLRRPRTGGVEVVASGRGDWIGWLELKTEAVDEVATRNTAQVIRDVKADVLAVVEAEHRISLCRFNEQVLKAAGGAPYDHVMVIDGNDDRGIDVGLMSRAPYRIDMVRSHVDDRDGAQRVFSRDCPEFHIPLPSGETLVVLVNHFKSKGYGGQASSNARRLAQAGRVRQIYEDLRGAGFPLVAVMGDLNDTPGSAPLAPLLAQNSDLKDVSEHPTFDDGGRPGTHGNCTASSKIDYVLLSPALFAKVKAGGIWRKGIWGGKNGVLWPIYPEMTKAAQSASDHAAVWVDLTL